jgi:hypothetical protein
MYMPVYYNFVVVPAVTAKNRIMCVCVCVCMYVCMYVCIYLCIYVYYTVVLAPGDPLRS